MRENPKGEFEENPSKKGSVVPWDAPTWIRMYGRAQSTGDKQLSRQLLRDVAEHNYKSRFGFGAIPKTVMMPVARALSASLGGVTLPSRPTRLTFSPVSTCDAIYHFAKENKRKVCALNFANGQQPGGGYKTGAVAQEEDLCRRMPQLYSSLWAAQTERMYPFGPCTYISPSEPSRYSDVLYTKDVWLGRQSSNEGFAVLPADRQVPCSIVSAAAPNGGKQEVSDPDLLYKTVEAIFRVPKLLEPEVNTLVLGAWGCGAFLCSPVEMSTLFVKALTIGGLGDLYEEIHFAILSASPDDRNLSVFKDTFAKNGLQSTDINPRRANRGMPATDLRVNTEKRRSSGERTGPASPKVADPISPHSPGGSRPGGFHTSVSSALSARDGGAKQPKGILEQVADSLVQQLSPRSQRPSQTAGAAWASGEGAKRSGPPEPAGNPQATFSPKAKDRAQLAAQATEPAGNPQACWSPKGSVSPKGRAQASAAMPPAQTSSMLAPRGDAKGGAPARRLGNNVTPAAAAPQWEIGWSEDDQKYYFLDRQSGLSSWERPAGCDLEVPMKPPEQPRKAAAEKQAALPPGWEMAFDYVHKKHYYYNHSTNERTWKHPGMDASAAAAAARPISTS